MRVYQSLFSLIVVSMGLNYRNLSITKMMVFLMLSFAEKDVGSYGTALFLRDLSIFLLRYGLC
jgi:hypothetical protein